MNFKVAVVGGAGHIGLPLSCYIQNNGIETLIVDKNLESLEQISKGIPPFFEENFEENLKSALDSGLASTTDVSSIANKNVVILTLGTSSKKIDKELFEEVLKEVFKYIQEDTILILRSTLESGTVQKIYENFQLDKKNIILTYCPERLAEGFAFEEIKTLPQIVGALNHEEYQKIKIFFDLLNINTIFASYKEAEFIKLFLNTYRYSQFSLMNYFSNIASEQSLDFKKLLDIARTDYPRLNGSPDPGFVGGPCLIKDSKTFAESYDDNLEIINKMLVTNQIYMNNIITEIKNKFIGNKIIQLGITFKPDSDDLRDSQSLLLNELLKEDGYEIEVVDPHVYNSKQYSDVKLFSDNVLISTFHKEFKNLNFENKKVVIVGNK